MCSLHNQPVCAIKCKDLEEGSTLKCILCMMKEKSNLKELITLLEIFNPEVEQESSALLHLSDEELAKLTKIQSDNTESLIRTISNFFSSLKEEAMKKINEKEKIAINQVYGLIEKQKQLKEIYAEFSSRENLKVLISTHSSNLEVLDEKLKKYFKEFNESMGGKQEEIQQLIAGYDSIIFCEDIPNVLSEKIFCEIS